MTAQATGPEVADVSVEARALSVWLAAAIAASAFAPRINPILLFALALFLLWPGRWGKIAAAGLIRVPSVYAWPFMALIGLALVSIAWSIGPSLTVHAALVAAGCFAVVCVASVLWSTHNEGALANVTYWAVVGFVIASVFLVEEGLSDLAVTRAGSPRVNRLIIAEHLNRACTCVAFLLFPVLLAVRMLFGRWALRRAATLSVTVLACFGIYALEHQTSQLALIAGALTLVASRFAPRATRIVMIGAVCIGTLGMASLISLIEQKRDAFKGQIPESLDARLDIWETTISKLSVRPMFGVGADATRQLETMSGTHGRGPATSEPETRRTDIHAHNAYLQVRLELGLVGAALLAAAGVAAVMSIGRWPLFMQPYGLATLSVIATTLTAGWGFWQAWLMACLAIVTCLLLLFDELASRRAYTGQDPTLRAMVVHDIRESVRIFLPARMTPWLSSEPWTVLATRRLHASRLARVKRAATIFICCVGAAIGVLFLVAAMTLNRSMTDLPRGAVVAVFYTDTEADRARRVSKALEIAKATDARLIAAVGGARPERNYFGSDEIRKALTDGGWAADRISVDTTSNDTFSNVGAIPVPSGNVIAVSDDFHLLRIRWLAGRRLHSVKLYAAPTDRAPVLHQFSRAFYELVAWPYTVLLPNRVKSVVLKAIGRR